MEDDRAQRARRLGQFRCAIEPHPNPWQLSTHVRLCVHMALATSAGSGIGDARYDRAQAVRVAAIATPLLGASAFRHGLQGCGRHGNEERHRGGREAAPGEASVQIFREEADRQDAGHCLVLCVVRFAGDSRPRRQVAVDCAHNLVGWPLHIRHNANTGADVPGGRGRGRDDRGGGPVQIWYQPAPAVGAAVTGGHQPTLPPPDPAQVGTGHGAAEHGSV
mmetsp:Transcript_7392/g.24372  ORF Transcript_7392/g.24372 Transcript_7392/m.24372 type:complete len:220 (+) Transcript_7392:375-1034(+)